MASVRAALPVRAWANVSPRAGAGWTVGAISMATALAGVAAAAGGRSPIELAAIAACAAALTALGVIDVRTRRIPNRLIYPALGLALVIALVDPARSFGGALAGAVFSGGVFAVAFFVRPSVLFRRALSVPPRRRSSRNDVRWGGAAGALAMLVMGLAQPEHSVASAFATAVVAGCPFLPHFVVHEWGIREGATFTTVVRGMGGGDVKFAAVLGAVAGAPDVLSVLPVAVFGGAVAALILALVRRGGGAIPYGPFLASAALLALF
ncbi:MAG: prepilin peptidase [Dehalococcoidia bacterium]|nr:MAG: prepilin peptidase [Dehalococcoidia bacterium]